MAAFKVVEHRNMLNMLNHIKRSV